MQQAIDNALKNNPATQNAQLSVKGARMAKLGILNFEPTEFLYQKGQMNSKLIDQSFEINQNFGSLLTHYQSSRFVNNQINLAETELKITEKELETQVKIAYQYWVYLINSFQIKQEQTLMFKEFERISQAKYTYGETNLLGKVLAETEYSRVKNELLKATEQLILAENFLKQLMHVEGNFIPENDTLLIYQMESTPDSIERFSNNVMVSYYKNVYEIESTKHKIEQSKYFPAISAGYFNQEIDNQSGFEGWSIGITIPIWFLPQNASVQQAKIEKEKALNNLEYQKFNLDKEIENMVVQLDQLQNDLIYYNEKGLVKADLLIHTAKTQFEKEEIEYFEFLQGIKAAQEIKMEYLSTLYNYNKTAIELEFYTK